MDKSVLWEFRSRQDLCSLKLVPSSLATSVNKIVILLHLLSQSFLSFTFHIQSVPKFCVQNVSNSTLLHLQPSLSCHHFSPRWPKWLFNWFLFPHSFTALHLLLKLIWDHVTSLLRILKWLLIVVRIKFILLTMAPVHILWLWSGSCLPLKSHLRPLSTSSLPFSYACLPSVPQTCQAVSCHKVFALAISTAWNSFPLFFKWYLLLIFISQFNCSSSMRLSLRILVKLGSIH